MPTIFHSVEPEANRTQFEEYNSVDFVISTDRNILRNSIRIEGTLRVNQTANTRAVFTDRIHLNKRVGIHNIIDSIQTQIGGNIVENVNQDYGRFVHMVQSASKSRGDYYDSAEICELKAVSTDVAVAQCCGESDLGDTPAFVDMDFSFKPLIAINRADNNLPMARLGNEIRISMNLNRKDNVLCGPKQILGSNYKLGELRLTYMSVDPSAVPAVNMNSVISIKQNLNSSNASINSRVPAVCNACSISFLKASRENQIVSDNLALEVPPKIDEIQFLFNDSTNIMQQYTQNEYGEYLEGYLDSLKSAGVHQVSPNNIKGNSVFGIGQNFGQAVDLSNQKFGVQVKSSAGTNNAYIMYQYFHSQISV